MNQGKAMSICNPCVAGSIPVRSTFCAYSIMVIITDFQSEDVSSILTTRSNKPLGARERRQGRQSFAHLPSES